MDYATYAKKWMGDLLKLVVAIILIIGLVVFFQLEKWYDDLDMFTKNKIKSMELLAIVILSI